MYNEGRSIRITRVLILEAVNRKVNTTKDGFYDAGNEERVRHLQGSTEASFRVFEPEFLPEPEGFGEFPLGLSEFVDVAGQ